MVAPAFIKYIKKLQLKILFVIAKLSILFMSKFVISFLIFIFFIKKIDNPFTRDYKGLIPN